MFGPEYNLAKFRQEQFLAEAAEQHGMDHQTRAWVRVGLRARLLLAVGDLLIDAGYRLRCSVAPQAC